MGGTLTLDWGTRPPYNLSTGVSDFVVRIFGRNLKLTIGIIFVELVRVTMIGSLGLQITKLIFRFFRLILNFYG